MSPLRLIVSVLPVFFVGLFPAWAQTARSRSELYTQIDTTFASGTQITAAILRTGLKDLAASAQNPLTDGTAVVATGSYADPAWITSLAFSKITGLPTSLALLGISNGAALDAIGANGGSYYLARANHTGTQAAATISDFASAAAAAAPVQSVAGRTGAVTLAKADVGLTNVDNTADLSKPISTATQAALDAKLGASAQAADVNPSGTAIASALSNKLGTTAQAADVAPTGTAIAAALAGKAASSHTHVATAISDSTATGRAVLTAADAAAARTAIGAGTSSFTGAYADLSGKPTLGDAAAKNTGSGAGEVAAGNHTHAGVYEPILGTPASDGYVLTSTAAGVRSWTAPGSGGGAAEKWDVVFDGQGAVVSSNVTVYRPVTVTGTIAAGVLIADVSGNATVSITRHTPSGGTLGSGTPLGNLTLSSAAHMRDTTLSGWTTAVTAGDVLAIKTESTTAARRLSVNLTQ